MIRKLRIRGVSLAPGNRSRVLQLGCRDSPDSKAGVLSATPAVVINPWSSGWVKQGWADHW